MSTRRVVHASGSHASLLAILGRMLAGCTDASFIDDAIDDAAIDDIAITDAPSGEDQTTSRDVAVFDASVDATTLPMCCRWYGAHVLVDAGCIGGGRVIECLRPDPPWRGPCRTNGLITCYQRREPDGRVTVIQGYSSPPVGVRLPPSYSSCDEEVKSRLHSMPQCFP